MNQQNLANSDVTMAVSSTFDHILDQVKTSNLNFWIQLSPFSATISLKKSLVKDVSGQPLLPPILNSKPVIKSECDNHDDLLQKVCKLEIDLEQMKSVHAEAIDDNADAYKKIKLLKQELKNMKATKDETIEQLSIEKHNVEHELESEVKKSRSINNRLKEEISEMRVKHQKDKTETIKHLKSEIKSWKKDLGDERSEKLKVEKELELVKNELSSNIGIDANHDDGDMSKQAISVKEKDDNIYTVKTNNIFEALAKQVNTSVKGKNDATKEDKDLELKVNHNNYKQNLRKLQRK